MIYYVEIGKIVVHLNHQYNQFNQDEKQQVEVQREEQKDLDNGAIRVREDWQYWNLIS